MKPTHLWTLFAATPHLRQDAPLGTGGRNRSKEEWLQSEAETGGKYNRNKKEKRNSYVLFILQHAHLWVCVLLFQYILSGHKGPLVAGQVLFYKIMISQKRQNWNKALVIQRTAFLCMQSEWKHNLYVYLFNANADKKSNKAVQL